MVKQPDKVEVIFASVFTGEPDHGKEQGYCAAVAGKAALPGHEDFQEALPAAKVIIRLIEKAMAKTCAHNCSDDEGYEQGIQHFGIDLFPLAEPLEYEPAKAEARHEHK